MNIDMSFEPIIGAFTDVFNTMMQSEINRRQIRAAAALNQQSMQNQLDVNQMSLDAQKEMNAYNSPASQLSRLANSGVNLSFLGGDSINSGNQSSIPSFGAASLAMPTLGTPVAGALSASMNGLGLREAQTEKTEAETAAIRFQLKIDRKFKEKEVQQSLDALNAQIAQGNATVDLLKRQITTQDLENARRELENKFNEETYDIRFKQVAENLNLTTEQVKKVTADAVVAAAQNRKLTAEAIYQEWVNKMKKEHEVIFLASQLPDGIAGAIALALDSLGCDADTIKKFIKSVFGKDNPGGNAIHSEVSHNNTPGTTGFAPVTTY